MIGVVMAGGRGSRMGAGEKLLLRYKKPIVLHVLEALRDSGCFSGIHAATSPNSPQTMTLLTDMGYSVIDTPGDGYSKDLSRILQGMDGPVFVTSADLPLLDGPVVREIVRRYDPGMRWMSVLLSEGFLDSLGLSSDVGAVFGGEQCRYAGISVVDSSQISDGVVPEQYTVLDDKRIAFNVNTRRDYELLGTA